ncbi:hypothetical protein CIB48_g11344 [Xylaria polymorpha]|nr:hypothetical protein CIB48_g11344 [Xylaria polymorpha]
MQLTNAIFHIHAWQHRIVQKCVLELHSVPEIDCCVTQEDIVTWIERMFLGALAKPAVLGIGGFVVFLRFMNNLTMVKEFGLGTHIQALTLRSEGYSRAAIVAKTGYTPANQGPKTRAWQRSPTDLTDEGKQKITSILTSEKACRKFSAQQLAEKFHEQNPDDPTTSRRTVLRALKAEESKKSNSATCSGGWLALALYYLGLGENSLHSFFQAMLTHSPSRRARLEGVRATKPNLSYQSRLLF